MRRSSKGSRLAQSESTSLSPLQIETEQPFISVDRQKGSAQDEQHTGSMFWVQEAASPNEKPTHPNRVKFSLFLRLVAQTYDRSHATPPSLNGHTNE